VKAVGPDSHSQESLFDVIPGLIDESTVQFVRVKDSQIATSIKKKFCIGDIVFLSDSIQERRDVSSSMSQMLHFV